VVEVEVEVEVAFEVEEVVLVVEPVEEGNMTVGMAPTRVVTPPTIPPRSVKGFAAAEAAKMPGFALFPPRRSPTTPPRPCLLLRERRCKPWCVSMKGSSKGARNKE
jgi:hypothetical protein